MKAAIIKAFDLFFWRGKLAITTTHRHFPYWGKGGGRGRARYDIHWSPKAIDHLFFLWYESTFAYLKLFQLFKVLTYLLQKISLTSHSRRLAHFCSRIFSRVIVVVQLKWLLSALAALFDSNSPGIKNYGKQLPPRSRLDCLLSAAALYDYKSRALLPPFFADREFPRKKEGQRGSIFNRPHLLPRCLARSWNSLWLSLSFHSRNFLSSCQFNVKSERGLSLPVRHCFAWPNFESFFILRTLRRPPVSPSAKGILN